MADGTVLTLNAIPSKFSIFSVMFFFVKKIKIQGQEITRKYGNSQADATLYKLPCLNSFGFAAPSLLQVMLSRIIQIGQIGNASSRGRIGSNTTA